MQKPLYHVIWFVQLCIANRCAVVQGAPKYCSPLTPGAVDCAHMFALVMLDGLLSTNLFYSTCFTIKKKKKHQYIYIF